MDWKSAKQEKLENIGKENISFSNFIYLFKEFEDLSVRNNLSFFDF